MLAKIFPIRNLLILSVVLLQACKKDSSSGNNFPLSTDTALASYFPAGKTVYLVGQVGGNIVYWKNGVKTVLDSNGRPTCMVFEEGDLLIGGLVLKGQSDELAVYWQNGEKHLLTDTLSSNIAAVHKWKGDVYACGHMFDRELFESTSAQVHAVYWKNGDSVGLSPDSQGTTNDFAFSGNDMYVVGQIDDSYQAVVWKNGEVSPFGSPGVMYGILTSGSDLYYSGDFSNPVNGAYNTIRIFKNDNSAAIDSINGLGKIAVVGSDMYVYGSILDDTDHSQAAYWKNGVLTVLSSTHQSSRATGLVVMGNDVFIVGSFQNDGNETAILWKNGQEIVVSSGANLVGIAVE